MPAEIDIRALTLRVLHGKGDRSRAGGFDQRTADILLAWIECRKMVPTTERSPLFCTLRGKRLASANVRETIHRLGRQAGVEKRVHPHGLRHTLASQLAGAGESLVDIQVILGHASIATTAGYIRHLNPIGAISILQKGIR
jgi:site-specific recombinase XerD